VLAEHCPPEDVPAGRVPERGEHTVDALLVDPTYNHKVVR
jgi:hypothetical protein